jgi:hypothetical protein
MNRFERWSIAMSTLTLMAVVFAGVVYYWQWGTMKDALRAANRAWVLPNNFPMAKLKIPEGSGPVCDVEPIDPNDSGGIVHVKKARVLVDIKNFGKGPAFHVQPWIRIVCLPRGQPCPDASTTLETPSGAMLGQGQHLYIDREYSWEESCKMADVIARTGTRMLFAYGKIDYLDQFMKPHWTKYCARFNPRALLWDWAMEGNGTDRDQ